MRKLLKLLLLIGCLSSFASAAVRDCKATYGATGNGVTDDTSAINTCLAAAGSGDTVLLSGATSVYKVTSLNTLNVNNLTIKGDPAGTTKLLFTSTGATYAWTLGGGSLGSSSPLNADAAELATSYTTSLSSSVGDYHLIQQGGVDSSTGSSASQCDISGCRGQVVKVTGVSGTTISIDGVLYDSYNVATNGANVSKLNSVMSGLTLQDLVIDGNSHAVKNGILFQNVVNSTITNVTGNAFANSAFFSQYTYGVTWTHVTETNSGSGSSAAISFKLGHGKLVINGMTLSQPYTSSPTGASFGLFFGSLAGATLNNITIDWAGANGRPFKTIALRYSSLDSLVVKNGGGSGHYMNVSLEYYSAHNFFSNCTISGGATANIDLFGNYNDYNTFKNCKVTSGSNGSLVNVLLGASHDGRRDQHLTIDGGTYSCSGTCSQPAIQQFGNYGYIHGAQIGPDAGGGIDNSSTNTVGACLEDNIFSAGMAYAYDGTGSTGNANRNTLGSSAKSPFPTGACGLSITVPPSFGSVAVGTSSSTQILTLTNSTGGSLTIGSIAAFGDYSQTHSCGSTLGAGSSCTITVTFTPTATGTRTGSVVVSMTNGSSATAALTGTGGTGPSTTFGPSSITFPNQATSTTSAAQSTTLMNGGTSALTISSIALTTGTQFAISSNTCGGTLAVNASCVVSVTFTPTTSGAKTDSIVFTDNASGSPQSVALSGTGVSNSPAASFSPTSLAFGNQQTSTTSASQTATLTNSGGASLSISSIALQTGTQFAITTNTCGSTLAAGANCSVAVTFTPTTTGSKTDNLQFTDTAAGSPQSVALSGTGTNAVASLSSSGLAYGTVTVGVTTAGQTVTLTNTGSATLNISSIALQTGTQFAISANTCGSTLTASSTCNVTVTFTPTGTGGQSDSLLFTDDGSGSPQSVNLDGTGGTTGGGSGSPSGTPSGTDSNCGGDFACINLDTQIKGSRLPFFGVDSGAANAYVVTTIAPLGPALRIGSQVMFFAVHANTTASTVTVDGGAAIAIKKNVSVALAAGDIPAGVLTILTYDGTNFQIPVVPSYILQVNGTALTAGDTVNFNGSTPAAPSNSANGTWQKSTSGGVDSLSLYFGAAGASLGLTKSGACSAGNHADGTYNSDGTPHCSADSGGSTTDYRTCTMGFGSNNLAGALLDADLSPQVSNRCYTPTGATVVEVMITADGGTPSVTVAKNHLGSDTNLTSSALATAASGGRACSNAGGTTSLDGSTTCGSTLTTTSLAAGDYLEPNGGTAGGTAKSVSVQITYSVTATTTHVCMMSFGYNNAASALANADLSPQIENRCYLPAGSTVTEVMVTADGGTPSIRVARNHLTTLTNLTSADLTTASSGGRACSNAAGTTSLDGSTTCTNTLNVTSLSAGDFIEPNGGTAGGTAKAMSVAITYTTP